MKRQLSGRSNRFAAASLGEMLLLVDLDNTLIDRAYAFDAWAIDFVRLLGRPTSAAEWLIEADRDGYEPRDSLARAIKGRLGLEMAVEDLVGRLRFEHVRSMTIEALTTQALAKARKYGWKIAIVTNGTTAQQMLKIQKVGLEPYTRWMPMPQSASPPTRELH